MGLLDQVLGNVLGSRAGGGIPGDTVSGRAGRSGMSPIMMALLALLATKGMSNRGSSGGGLGDLLGNGLGGLMGGQGGLGGLLGNGSGAGSSFNGGILAGGLGGLIESLTRSGHADIANSWVGRGSNQPIAPDQLADAIDPQMIDELSQQTGMPRGDLLSGLADVLPGVVDQLTPEGRLPREEEFHRY
jgi:uncharacterized protein YidB (DUF937 family)